MASVLRLLSTLPRLRSWQLVAVAAVLFLIDLFVPDPLPFVDEGVLGLLTLWLSRGMSRALLKLSGSLVHDYATISDDSPSPNRASRARRAATSAGIS